MRDKQLKIAIIGAGGIGGLLAALLDRYNYDVTLITSEDSMNQIQKNGLDVRSSYFGNFNSKINSKISLDFEIDQIIFTTKFPFLTQSFKRIDRSKIGKPVFISLLNGLGNREKIIDQFGNNFITGTIGSIEVYRDKKGVIIHKSSKPPQISLAKEKEVNIDFLQTTIDVIESLDIQTRIYSTHHEVIWNKLVRLGAISAVTSAYQENLGNIIKSNEKNAVLIGLVEEGAAVANACGVEIIPSVVKKEINLLPESLMTSLSRDIDRGVDSEIDSITIAIIEEAKKKNIKSPFYEMILNKILNEQ